MADANINWLLFLKPNEIEPVSFAELLWIDGRLYHNWGKVWTWGESTTEYFDKQVILEDAIESKRVALLDEGFTLVRTWSFEPTHFDFKLLKSEIELATSRMVRRLREKYPKVNAFALGTDHDAMTILPMAHCFDSIIDANDELLWAPDEWSISESDESFDIPYRLILSQKRNDLTKVDYLTYKSGFREAAIAALEKIDSDGVFGDRAKRVVLFHRNGSYAKWGAVKRLNSAELYARWENWWGTIDRLGD